MPSISTGLSALLVVAIASFAIARPSPARSETIALASAAPAHHDFSKAKIDYMPVGTTKQVESQKRARAKKG